MGTLSIISKRNVYVRSKLPKREFYSNCAIMRNLHTESGQRIVAFV